MKTRAAFFAVALTLIFQFAFLSAVLYAEEAAGTPVEKHREIPAELTRSVQKNRPGETPQSMTIKVGEKATFTLDPVFIAAWLKEIGEENTPPTFQWHKNGDNKGNQIPGATSSSYTTPPVTLADNGSMYVCKINGQAIGFTALSAAWLYVYDEGEKLRDWTKIADHATWSNRDSLEPLVFNGKMWILEGWHRHGVMTADVWNTKDGKDWDFVMEQGPWKDSDMHSTAVFKNKMWLMGGCHMSTGKCSNEIYSSADGVKWDLVNPKAAWSPRSNASLVVFKDKLWLTGGVTVPDGPNGGDQNNEVWCSSDGINWEQITAKAEWGTRCDHRTIVLNNKLYLFGGRGGPGGSITYNDVWSSDDGIKWTKLLDSAPWYPRFWFQTVIYRDRMWVIGAGPANGDDVWHSKDGVNWKQLKSKVMWRGRHAHGALVYQDKIFIFGGSTFRWGLTQADNDVWSLEIPPGWLDEK